MVRRPRIGRDEIARRSDERAVVACPVAAPGGDGHGSPVSGPRAGGVMPWRVEEEEHHGG
jgi:hypothetical protein